MHGGLEAQDRLEAGCPIHDLEALISDLATTQILLFCIMMCTATASDATSVATPGLAGDLPNLRG
jgi:hypothetical protein